MKMRAALFAVVVMTIGVTACDDDGGSTSDAAVPVAVTATDFAFAPEVVTIPAGADVRVTLENSGMVEHYWVVLSEPISAEDQFDDGLVLFEIEAHENDTTTKFLRDDMAPGTYQVICPVPGHFAAGMVGELKVTG